MQLNLATKKQLEEWDRYIDSSVNGTIFHKRKFLSYHKDKFAGKEKYLVIENGTSLYAQICMTIEEENGKKIAKSPYGASYGGFVFQTIPTYTRGREIVGLFMEYLRQEGVDICILTNPIAACSEKSLDTFYFNLMEAGFCSDKREVSSLYQFPVCGSAWDNLSGSVRTKARKAISMGAELDLNPDIEAMYQVLEEEKREKYFTKPTHSKEEFCELHKRFPKEIFSVGVKYEGNYISGATIFTINKQMASAFYLYMKTDCQIASSMRYVVCAVLGLLEKRGITYLDFGLSTTSMVAYENIFGFKEEFKTSGMFRETFKWENKSGEIKTF